MNISTVQKEFCFGCASCAQKCPTGAISMERDSYGFLYPKIDESKCTHCGLCKKACPAINTSKEKSEPITKAFAVKSKHSKECASGGVFFHLAKKVIETGGYIAGTVWNDEFLPETVVTNDPYTLEKMKGSKYVQASTGTSYKDTLNLLKKDIMVLYSGTPCQIAGLYKFLGKDYDNLITVEILCHAAGSPMVWQKYIDFAQRKYGKKIVDCKMQNTKNKLVLYFDDNTSVTEGFYGDNEYTDIYIQGKTKRDNCSNCPYMGRVRNADIIIGDIWAKWAKKKRKDGISLLILNSQKAEDFCKSYDWEIYKKFNINLRRNRPLNKINNNVPKAHPERNNFLEKVLNTEKYEDAIANKKVALMNFNYPRDNYGALLLAYAMEQVIQKLGYEPYTINYYKNPLTMMFDPQGPTWKFREKYLNLYGYAHDKNELYPYVEDFDKFVFGSDIIWHQTREYVYWADWVYGDKLLVAYAASFCQNKLPKPDKYKKLCMQRFDKVSVRESSGVDICKKYANVDATMVIDPSMLLTKEDYQCIIDNEFSEVPEGDYLVYYTFWQTNLYDIPIKMPIYDLFKDNSNNTRTFGQWLNLIKNSKYVLTSSFHGVCFSLLFNKPFIYMAKPAEDNERVCSLFRKFDISFDRFVTSEKEVTLERMNQVIDWESINSKICEFREYSLDWLKSALEEKPKHKKIINSEQKKYHEINILGLKLKIKKKKRH